MRKAKRVPRDPENTIKGKLALMTDDRNHFQAEASRLRDENRMLQSALESTKREAISDLRWHRQLIQELSTKIPGAR